MQDFPYQHNLLVILSPTQFCSNGHRAVDKPIFHSTQMFWVVNKCTSLDLWVIKADHCSSEISEPWLLKVLSQISMTCKSTSTSLSVNCMFIVCLKEFSSAVGKNQSDFFYITSLQSITNAPRRGLAREFKKFTPLDQLQTHALRIASTLFSPPSLNQ